jgi:hypothetical protein
VEHSAANAALMRVRTPLDTRYRFTLFIFKNMNFEFRKRHHDHALLSFTFFFSKNMNFEFRKVKKVSPGRFRKNGSPARQQRLFLHPTTTHHPSRGRFAPPYAQTEWHYFFFRPWTVPIETQFVAVCSSGGISSRAFSFLSVSPVDLFLCRLWLCDS